MKKMIRTAHHSLMFLSWNLAFWVSSLASSEMGQIQQLLDIRHLLKQNNYTLI